MSGWWPITDPIGTQTLSRCSRPRPIGSTRCARSRAWTGLAAAIWRSPRQRRPAGLRVPWWPTSCRSWAGITGATKPMRSPNRSAPVSLSAGAPGSGWTPPTTAARGSTAITARSWSPTCGADSCRTGALDGLERRRLADRRASARRHRRRRRAPRRAVRPTHRQAHGHPRRRGRLRGDPAGQRTGVAGTGDGVLAGPP